jgi:hypothetical protein
MRRKLAWGAVAAAGAGAAILTRRIMTRTAEDTPPAELESEQPEPMPCQPGDGCDEPACTTECGMTVDSDVDA